MKNAKKRKNIILPIFTAAMVSLLPLLSCSDNPSAPPPDSNGGDWNPEYSCTPGGTAEGLDLNRNDLGLDNAVAIRFNGGSATVNGDGAITVTRNGAHIIVNTNDTRDHNIVVSGATSNGSLIIFGNQRFRLYLVGVNIRNPNGPAINIQNNSRTDVFLTGSGCGRNFLEDGANYPTSYFDENANAFMQAKGTFFSEASLIFHDAGASLEVRSKNNHAIVTDDHLIMNGGNIIIYESANDGIHANDDITINGGKLQVRSQGDALQVERNNKNIIISGGEISLLTTGIKSHGFASDSGDVEIGGNALIRITTLGNGSKGIRSRREVKINGGDIDIKTHGNIDITPQNERDPNDPDSTSRAAGIRAIGDVSIKAGILNIISSGEIARGINSDGNVTVTNGIVTIRSNGDGIKVGDDGYFNMSGGSVSVRVASGQEIDCGGRHNVTGGDLDALLDDRHR